MCLILKSLYYVSGEGSASSRDDREKQPPVKRTMLTMPLVIPLLPSFLLTYGEALRVVVITKTLRACNVG